MDRIISADSHVIEPHNLWQERVSSRYRDLVPKLVHEETTDRIICEDMALDVPVGLITGVMRSDADARAEGRWEEDVPKAAFDPTERLKAMNQDGLSGEVLYPTLGMGMFVIRDHEMLWECLRAFNTWMAEYCSVAPDVLKGLGMLVTDSGEVDAAIVELKRAKEIGLAGMMLPLDEDDDVRLTATEFDPFWELAADLEIPIHFHKSAGRNGEMVHNRPVDLTLSTVTMQRLLCGLIFSGLFDRFPKLNIVSGENEASWIGSVAERASYVSRRYKNLRGKQIKNVRTPMEIVAEQVWITFTRDSAAPAVAEVIPANLMWGSDFPHNVSTWPNSREFLDNEFKGRSPEVIEATVYSNAARLYGYSLV